MRAAKPKEPMKNNVHLLPPADLISTTDVRATLLKAAKSAAQQTLPLFRSNLAVDNKLADGFDPVTAADQNAEDAIREMITKDFPDHGIIGEERANKNTDSDFAWIIDPVDGTRAFVSGLPVWGTLIGVTYKGFGFAGLMSQPFTGETYLAINGTSELHHRDTVTQLSVRDTADIEQAIMFTTTPALFDTPESRAAFDAVDQQVQLTRFGCDCYAYALLAAGHIDLIIEPRMNTYDIAALVPLIENAGGTVSTWSGERAEQGGDIIAAATPELRDKALKLMRQHIDF